MAQQILSNDDKQTLSSQVEQILDQAKKQGADAAEVQASLSSGLSCQVRMGELETLEFNKDQGFAISVYLDGCKGTASTTECTEDAIIQAVKAACDIAKFTNQDSYAGLAEANLMAKELPDLDLYHPWALSPEQAIELALEADSRARAMSPLITNSDGSGISSHQGCSAYANSQGFIGVYQGSRHSASSVMIATDKGDMQRDYWYTVARNANDLLSMQSLGELAAKRTLSRLHPKKLKTAKMPVLFSAETASGLASHLLSAISGSSLYRKSSFLLDQLNESIFPNWMQIDERPRIKGALGSAAFDADGLATREKAFIEQGILTSYILGTYSGRKLELPSTANAGGVHNVFVKANSGDQTELLQKMGTGLLVTELMGSGVNPVTGDYSRGASGFWVENGEIQYPVAEITIASNLKEMYKNLVAVGSDVDHRGNVLTGSWLLESMTVSGN